jgi:hypothetical protein
MTPSEALKSIRTLVEAKASAVPLWAPQGCRWTEVLSRARRAKRFLWRARAA